MEQNQTPQTAPVKKALCVNQNVGNMPMSHWPTFLVDRAVCDSKESIDTSVLQLLPYVTLFRQGNVNEGEQAGSLYVLAYERASGSGESRLIGKSSIGFGGHIDKEVEFSILNTVVEEASRELNEELGYVIDQKLMYRSALEAIISKRLIYLTTSEVDSVHLGLSVMVDYDSEPNKVDFTASSQEVANLRWVCMDNVSAEELPAFENWSSFLIQRFQQEMKQERDNHAQRQEMLRKMTEQALAQQMPEGQPSETSAQTNDGEVVYQPV